MQHRSSCSLRRQVEKDSLLERKHLHRKQQLQVIHTDLRGRSKNGTEHKNLYLTWKVPYADGTLEAVAYDADGNIIENTTDVPAVTTTGRSCKIADVSRQNRDAAGWKRFILCDS